MLWPFWDQGGFPKASQPWWDRFWLNMDPKGAMGTRFKPKTMIFCVSETSELFRSETCALLTPEACSLFTYETCSLLRYETCALLTYETYSLLLTYGTCSLFRSASSPMVRASCPQGPLKIGLLNFSSPLYGRRACRGLLGAENLTF